jgi:hypothetical protein
MAPSIDHRRTWKNSPWTVVIGFPLLCVFLLAVLGPWAISRSYRQSAQRACIANLNQIEGAQRTRELDHRHPGWRGGLYRFTDDDLFGSNNYIPEKPICPAGGFYTLGASSATNESAYVKPRCSIPGHTI